MAFGEHTTIIPNRLKIAQDDLAKKIGTSGPISGHNQCKEIKPFIETAARIAAELNVTLDYLLTGSGLVLDKKMMHCLELQQQLEKEDRNSLLMVVDNYLTTTQLHSTSKKLNKKRS